jgi:DNA-binding MarR family transcriptional regulator
MQIPITTLIQFRDNLRGLEAEVTKYFKYETGCCGVTFPQCHIISALDVHGETSIKQLATIMEQNTSTLSRVIDGMVNVGLVERQIDPADRRAVILRLTEKGKGIAETINQQFTILCQQVFHYLPEEKHAMLIESLALLSTAIKAVRQQDPAGSEIQCNCQ